MQDRLKQLSSFSEDSSKIIRFCALLSTILGAYYFLAYMIHLGLPFPLDLTVLPTALLAIGVASIFLTVLIILYLFMAAWVHLDPFNIDYPVLINTNTHGIFAPSWKVLLINWVLIYGGPIGIWLLLLFQGALPQSQIGVYLFLMAYLIWAVLFGVAKVQGGQSRLLSADCGRLLFLHQVASFGRSEWFTALKISMTTFVVSCLGQLSSILFILALSSRGLLGTVERQLIAFLFFLCLNFFALATYVVPSAISPGSADEAEGKPDAKALKGRLFRSPITTFFGCILAMTILPDIAPHVGELPLRLLNIGGGVERLFYLNCKVAEDMPAEILEMCGDKCVKCRLKPLYVLLDLGQTIYVRVVGDKNSAIYRIPRAGLIDVLARTGEKPNKRTGADAR